MKKYNMVYMINIFPVDRNGKKTNCIHHLAEKLPTAVDKRKMLVKKEFGKGIEYRPASPSVKANLKDGCHISEFLEDQMLEVVRGLTVVGHVSISRERIY